MTDVGDKKPQSDPMLFRLVEAMARDLARADHSESRLMQKQKRDPLLRALARPTPDQWTDDEAMTLREAVAVFFPDGLLTIPSLRTEIRNGGLAAATIAGKIFTTAGAIRIMLKPCLRGSPTVGLSREQQPNGKAAQAAAALRFTRHRSPQS